MLVKRPADALGLIALFLTASNATPDSQDCMQPVLGPDEIVIRDAINAANAAVTNVSPIPPLGGTQDDGANITAALGKVGPVVLQRGATYNIATPIDFSASPGATLYGNGATATGAMARTGGTANSVILATPTLSGVGNTTLNGNAVIGARTLVVTAGAGIANGTFVQLQSAGGSQLTAYYLVIAGGTTNTLTFDRPIQEPFATADTVKPVSVMPRQPNVIGPLTINGNGDNGVSFVGVRRGYLRDVYVDVENAASGAACLTGGIDLDVGCLAVLVEDCVANGFNLASNADQFVIGIGLASCESCRIMRSAGRHATTAGIFVTSSYSCVLSQCEATDCGGTGTAIVFTGTAATSSASTDCVAENCYAADSAFGVGVSLATRLTLLATTIENCSTRHLDIGTGATASTDCIFDRVSCLTGAVTTAAILVDAAVVRPVFRNIRISGITGTASGVQINCDFRWDGFVATSDNTTTGTVFLEQSSAADSFLANFNITMKTVNAATKAFVFNGSGRYYLKNIVVGMGVANDFGFIQGGNGIVELDDVMVTNPGGGGGTTGFLANGATSVTRRKGRIDFSAAATPVTLVQSDQGSFVVNGATGVDITYKDVRAGAVVLSNIITKGGAPGVMSYAVVGATKVTMAGIAGDTSTDGYKILD